MNRRSFLTAVSAVLAAPFVPVTINRLEAPMMALVADAQRRYNLARSAELDVIAAQRLDLLYGFPVRPAVAVRILA